MNSWIFSICYYYCRYMWEYVSEDATNDGLPRRVSFKTPSPTAFADRTCIYILYITSLFYSVPFYISFLVLFYYPSGTTTGARYISCTERDLSFFLFFSWGPEMGPESRWHVHTRLVRFCLFFFLPVFLLCEVGAHTVRTLLEFLFISVCLWWSRGSHWYRPIIGTHAPYTKLFLIVFCMLLQSMSLRVDLSQSLGIFSSFARRECYIDFCGMKKERSFLKKIKMSASLALNFTIVESNKWSIMIKGWRISRCLSIGSRLTIVISHAWLLDPDWIRGL